MDCAMVEERDIVGISVPFAAGIAAGAFLCARTDIRTAVPADCLFLFLVGVLILTAHFGRIGRFDRLSDRLVSQSNHCDRSNHCHQKIFFAGIFLLTGLFCSLNSHVAAGVPEYAAFPLKDIAMRASARLKSVIDSIPYQTETTGPLVKALLTGDKCDLTKEITGIFRSSGASHILALSGLHLGVLYIILAKLTAPIGNSLTARRLRYSLIITAALFYTVMTGASPSIVRAFLFITINETCKLLGRKRDPVKVLLTALTIQLAARPDVISSVGFQLSYMAMAGIFILYPALERIYPASDGSRLASLDPFRKIWNAAMLSISCQVFTGPLAWHYFHTFPKYFILTNLTALPLTSAVMALSVATIALSFFGICPEPLVILNDHAVQALVFCLRIISGLDEPL